MTRIWVIILTLLFVISCRQAPGPAEKNLPTYRIGYMICNSEKETLARFIPLTALLGQRLGVNFIPVAIDTIDFTKKINEIDFAHTNSLLYIILQRFHGVEALAAEKKGSLGSRSQGVIAVLKKSGITSVAGLKGKSMIFGPMLAPTGFMSQMDVLQNAGLNPEEDLAFYTIPPGSFKHEKVIYGVLFEKYAAGAVPIDDLETMVAEGRIDAEDFSVIGQGPAIPYCNFSVTQRIDEALAKRFKEAVLGLTREDTVELNGERIKVLDRALVDGFEAIADRDFDVVREMAKRTNMPPYQKY